MSRLMQPLGLRITSNQARTVLTNQWVKSHAHLQQQQIRCKVSSRQTGGGKSKAGGKPNENRSAQTKGYLKKPKSASGNSADGKTDRFETFRQMLYEKDADTADQARLERLHQIVPEYQVHETIDRAWKLNERHQREQQDEALEKQYQSMNKALEELRITDIHLYLKVIKDENGSINRLQNIVQSNSSHSSSSTHINLNATGKLAGLFPRQIKLPVESLPKSDKVWDHDWKNPTDPSY